VALNASWVQLPLEPQEQPQPQQQQQQQLEKDNVGLLVPVPTPPVTTLDGYFGCLVSAFLQFTTGLGHSSAQVRA